MNCKFIININLNYKSVTNQLNTIKLVVNNKIIYLTIVILNIYVWLFYVFIEIKLYWCNEKSNVFQINDIVIRSNTTNSICCTKAR